MNEIDTLRGWLPIERYKLPNEGRQYVDLLIQRGSHYRRIPACYWSWAAKRWTSEYRDWQGYRLLKPTDKPLFVKLHVDEPWPAHLEPFRKKT
jgi:hypothetical protein